MKTPLSNLNVAIASGVSRYPSRPPFHPAEIFPEYPHKIVDVDPANGVYAMVRNSLRMLGMDAPHFGRASWNPLGELISPGQRVLIKPNFVLHYNASGGALEAVVTHPSVIRAIVDYVLIALENRGEIIIGDAPQMNCDLNALFNELGMNGLMRFLETASTHRGISVRLEDFRQERTVYRHGIVWERIPIRHQGDSHVRVTIGNESLMEPLDPSRLYGADYSRSETIRAHRNHIHHYLVAPAVLSSDVVISVPKLKVHRKVGVTLNLKNMVGISTDKNHLAHYSVGSPEKGGDEFSNPSWDDWAERWFSDMLLGTNWRVGRYPFLAWRAFRMLYRRIHNQRRTTAFTYGNWYGNDTAWRMVIDLNRILLFADADGKLHDRPARHYFSFIDGVVGGEGEGPLHPDAYESGVVLAGFNPVSVDWTAGRLMGFDPSKIALYSNMSTRMGEWIDGFDIRHCKVTSNVARMEKILSDEVTIFRFRPSAGWRGTIERYGLTTDELESSAASAEMISQ